MSISQRTFGVPAIFCIVAGRSVRQQVSVRRPLAVHLQTYTPTVSADVADQIITIASAGDSIWRVKLQSCPEVTLEGFRRCAEHTESLTTFQQADVGSERDRICWQIGSRSRTGHGAYK